MRTPVYLMCIKDTFHSPKCKNNLPNVDTTCNKNAIHLNSLVLNFQYSRPMNSIASSISSQNIGKNVLHFAFAKSLYVATYLSP